MFDSTLPKRHPTHIKETLSYKLFKESIPEHWLVRELSERDYGIDALIELVTLDNRVTGKLISIQLKSTDNFKFNSFNKFTVYSIEKQTTNYWLNSNIFTFLFVVDLKLNKIYFKSIEDYVREEYKTYSENNKFNYVFCPDDEFSVDKFVALYYWSENLRKADNELINLVKIYKDFSKFYYRNIRRDFHMLVDNEEVITEFNSLVFSINSLSKLMFVSWDLPTPEEYVADNDIGIDASYGDYFMYEYHMTEYLIMLDKKLLEILKVCKAVVCKKYLYYWQIKSQKLVDDFLAIPLLTIEEQYWSNR